MYKYVIFDLDGTLLDTLEDLANAVNWVCQQRGWPVHELNRYNSFVGNGAKRLMERAIPQNAGLTDDQIWQLREEFEARYAEHNAEMTKPYPGLTELLSKLKAEGIGIAVLSNKPHPSAVAVVDHYFPGVFEFVQGALDDAPTKPDPTLLFRLMERIGAEQHNTLFVGDSNVDIRTARNGGLKSCGVLWGFRTRQELENEGADLIAADAKELEHYIFE